ncbi:MAG: enoyl-CoA hydratase [Halanaerobiales bacterium]|nr:enoyl-CoA hydratase [Halanaerobiales bacterium]
MVILDYKYLELDKEGKLAILKINRPEALNALNKELLKELREALEFLEEDNELMVLIITGAGEKAFVAGADIGEMKGMSPLEAREFAKLGNSVFSLIEKSNKVVIAAVNGYALGGGNELALACDIRLATQKSRFGQPEVGLGITAGFGGTQRLTKLVGAGRAKELLLTGELIGAEEAFRIGLVNKVVSGDQLLEEARKLAERIIKNDPLAVKLTKSAVNFGLEEGIEQGLFFETNSFALCFSSEGQRRRMEAFLEKNK